MSRLRASLFAARQEIIRHGPLMVVKYNGGGEGWLSY